MSIFWVVYWVAAIIMLVGTSTTVWWAVKKEGEDFTLQALIVALCLTFIPVLNAIIVVLGSIYLVEHNIKLVLIKGRK